MKKLYIATLAIVLFSNCTDLLKPAQSVTNVLNKNPRELEEMGAFYVEGKMGNSFNLGILGINGFELQDTKNAEKAIYVHTSHPTLPAKEGETIKLQVKFWKEFNLATYSAYLFEEVEKKE